MKTKIKSLVHPLAAEFQFAGFSFPKWVWNLPRGSLARRLEEARHPFTSGYYHAPDPDRKNRGCAFYLDEKCGPFVLRWKWADEISPSIRHKGWYCDDFQSETIRGLVFRLPSGRGFLAGWSMGEGMASAIEPEVYASERDAAYVADAEAQRVAEREQENAERDRERLEAEEKAEEETERTYWQERGVMTA